VPIKVRATSNQHVREPFAGAQDFTFALPLPFACSGDTPCPYRRLTSSRGVTTRSATSVGRASPPQDQAHREGRPARAHQGGFEDGLLPGLEEFVQTRQLVIPWGERKALLRDEERMERIRETVKRDPARERQ
jgi:hypothetical protein